MQHRYLILNAYIYLEPVERIELPTDDYKTPVLPLNYTGIFLEQARGLEPLMLVWKTSVLTNYTMPTYLVTHRRFELTDNLD